jgi:hypothetical protein
MVLDLSASEGESGGLLRGTGVSSVVRDITYNRNDLFRNQAWKWNEL